VLTINELHTKRILKGFYCLREGMPMLDDVCLLFGEVPFKLHLKRLPYKYGKYHINMGGRRSGIGIEGTLLLVGA